MKSSLFAPYQGAWLHRIARHDGLGRVAGHSLRQPYGPRGFHRVVIERSNLHSKQMQVTPPVLMVAAMVTLLLMIPAVVIAALAAIWAGVSAEARMAFVAVATVWAVVMSRFVGS